MHTNGAIPPKLSSLQTTVSKAERFIAELRRRHVFKIAVGWAALVFAAIQVAQLTYPVFNFADWAYSATVYALLGLTPIVLVLAWIYDITSEGIRRTQPIAAEEAGAIALSPQLLAPPVFSPRSVAILPFVNLTAEQENEYFSDGITEDIIARASRIKNLKVISRTSIMQYKNTQKSVRTIGRELGVAAVLEGSIRRSGDRVRIVAQLLDARTDAHKWAETYDRVLDDIFRIQTDVANQIAAALQAELSPQEQELVANEPTENLEAYDLYLRARHEWNRRTGESLQKSEILLKQALALDEKFALAWAGLADAYVTQGVYGSLPPAEVMPKAREAAEQGLRIDATLTEALTALASYHALHQWDFKSARRAFDAAMEMSPQYTTAPQWLAMNVEVPLGHFDDAEKWMTRALELDPLSPVMTASLGVLAYYKRDFDLSLEICGDVLGTHPHFSFGYYFKGLALEGLGRFDEAITALQESVQLAGWSTEAQAALAHAYAQAGRASEARTAIAVLEAEATRRYVSPGYLAIPYVALGENERALTLLEQALAIRAVDLVWAGVRPAFDALRDQPRFQKVVNTILAGA